MYRKPGICLNAWKHESEGGGASTTTVGNDSTVPMIPTEQISCTSCLSKLTRFMIILGQGSLASHYSSKMESVSTESPETKQ